MADLKAVQDALASFSSSSTLASGKMLLKALGYDSDKTYDLSPNTYIGFFEDFVKGKVEGFSADNALSASWTTADIIFQVADEDLNYGHSSLFSTKALQQDLFKSFLFMTIGLAGETYSRTTLAKITREVNKAFLMPVIILFRYGSMLTLAVIQRRQSRRAGASDEDVLAKVTLIKDINIDKPHSAHVRILADLALDQLASREKHRINNFETLFRVWQEVLSTTELNKRFYKELSDWYFWASKLARFPRLPDEDKNRTEVALIRLITRLIFVWFLKEKGLVPDELFDRDRLNNILSDAYQLGNGGDGYYRAVLQNLFFATLNTEMNTAVPESRGFETASAQGQRYNSEYMIHTRYCYRDAFKDPEAALKLFENVPFLNGGLFECLDRTAVESPSGKEEQIDGFSDDTRKQAHVPDELFFGKAEIDLNEVYQTKNKRPVPVRGILSIFSSYKFTVDESTPVEEEIALDPELLGKVFENLLASYNPETETTARKQTGSFYTPRDIVNFMVDESLIAYFIGKLTEQGMEEKSATDKLHALFDYLDTPHDFEDDEVATLIEAIDAAKILDPACGSGAFPMGILQRLVELLGQLDPDNERWQEQQLERLIAPAIADKQQAEKISYDKARVSAVAELDERISEIRAAFAENDHNYARKLFLIENCIYGVDIQPIAIQIAKLRFFITLVVDQRVENNKINRGIIALPNLETKFVAANTLLALDSQTGLVFPEVAEKEKELEKVRSDHFNARRYAEKLSLRGRDHELRDTIENLLTKTGFGRDNAHHLAAWNPYNQNMAARFFDARWMFNIRDGFDIVIGNPPYGVRFDSEQKQTFTKAYNVAKDLLDSYILFIVKGLELTRKFGNLAYIVPNTFCDLEKGANFRQFILRKYSLIAIMQTGWAFDAAVVDTIAFSIKNIQPTGEGTTRILVNEDIYFRTQRSFLENVLAKIDYRNTPNSRYLLNKIYKNTFPLSKIATVSAGVKLYEKGKGNPPQSSEVVKTKPFSVVGKSPAGWKPLYRGKDVGKFLLSLPNEYVNYGEWLASPRQAMLFDGPKILMRRTDDQIMCSFEGKSAICTNSCHVIKLKDTQSKQFAYLFLMGVLNSRLIQYAFSTSNPQMTEKVFAEIKVVYVERFPLTEVQVDVQKLFAKLVEYVIHLKEPYDEPEKIIPAFSRPVLTTYFERIIDGMVYELYLPEELHAAGRSIIKHVEAEKLFDLDTIKGDKLAELQRIFEHLYAKDHPVRENLYFLDSIEEIRIIEGKA